MQVTSDLIKKYYPINIYPVITKLILNKIFNNIDIEFKIYSLLLNNEIKIYEPIIIRLSNYILNNYNCAAFYYKQQELNNNKIQNYILNSYSYAEIYYEQNELNSEKFNKIINIIVFLLNEINSNDYKILNENENENENEIIIQYKLIDNFSIKYKKQLKNIYIYYKHNYT